MLDQLKEEQHEHIHGASYDDLYSDTARKKLLAREFSWLLDLREKKELPMGPHWHLLLYQWAKQGTIIDISPFDVKYIIMKLKRYASLS